MKPNKKSVAKRLHLIKEEKNLTIQELGEAVGSTKENFKSYLRGLAVPPENVVNNLADFSGKSIEWIYYGEELDKVRDYLSFRGHEQLVEEFPKKIESIYESYKNILFDEDGAINTSRLMSYFNYTFKEIMYSYVSAVFEEMNIKEEVIKYPLYSVDELNYNYFRFEMGFKENLFLEMPDIKYGEKDRIINAAEKALEDYINLYKKYGPEYDKQKLFRLKDIDGASLITQVRELLIEKLETDEGTKEILNIIISNYNLIGFEVPEEEAELVRILKEFRLNLIQ